MRSQIGIDVRAHLQFVLDQALPENRMDLRFPADSKAQRVHFLASGVSAVALVFSRAAKWLSECIQEDVGRTS